MQGVDRKALEAALTKDLCVIMEGKSAIAFRKKEWAGNQWVGRKQEDGSLPLIFKKRKAVSSKETAPAVEKLWHTANNFSNTKVIKLPDISPSTKPLLGGGLALFQASRRFE